MKLHNSSLGVIGPYFEDQICGKNVISDEAQTITNHQSSHYTDITYWAIRLVQMDMGWLMMLVAYPYPLVRLKLIL